MRYIARLTIYMSAVIEADSEAEALTIASDMPDDQYNIDSSDVDVEPEDG